MANAIHNYTMNDQVSFQAIISKAEGKAVLKKRPVSEIIFLIKYL